MGRDKKKAPGGLVHLGFRGTKTLTARIDRLATLMGERLGGVNISRSQVLEVLVNHALPIVEVEYLIEDDVVEVAQLKAAHRCVAKEEARIRKLREWLNAFPDDAPDDD